MNIQAVYDAKSEEIGPGIYRFKAEIGALGAISSRIPAGLLCAHIDMYSGQMKYCRLFSAWLC